MKNKILIGYFLKVGISPITTINQAIINDLNDKYIFKPFYIYSKARQSHGKLNFSNILKSFFTWLRWLCLILKFKPQLVHFPITSYWAFEKSMFILYTAKLFGLKTVGHLHGGAFKEFFSGLKGFRKRFAYFALNKLDGIITLSHYWQDFIRSKLPSSNTFYVYNPIEKEFEDSFSAYERNYNIESLIFIGHVRRRKGVFDILKAIKPIKEVYIKIAGSGESKMDEFLMFKKEIVKNNLTEKTAILGTVHGQDKINLFKESGIFVLPSYTENFPLVIIEAACAGLPIIATRIGALPDIFTHNKNILFIEPGDINQLTWSINYLINSSAERERLGSSAKNIFMTQLNRDSIMKKFDTIYQELLQNDYQ